jgi:uncharacterized protein YbgA (DUF1722 family)/uncharacterized protein YbbK (DUF523 family)
MKETKSMEHQGWRAWHDESEPLRLGVSACLLGEEVRFDGGHKRDRFVTDVLGNWVEWVSVCPEVEVGMGTPRPSIRIVNSDAGERLVAPKTDQDFTEEMHSYSAQRISKLETLGLDGYVFKRGSPSCGMERIAVYHKGSPLHKNGRGLFAGALMDRMVGLPTEEDGRLNDPLLRENFIERILCHHRWRVAKKRGLTRMLLVKFHEAHKLLLRTHDEGGYRRLGTLVGSAGTMPDEELYASYGREFHACLKIKPTVKRHTNALQHAMGYFKTLLDPVEKQELLQTIEDYRLGLIPLVVPLSLLRFNARRHQVEYLLGQLYFDPHPKELMLRNHC